jgi:trk system potassium uptake protein TrkA
MSAYNTRMEEISSTGVVIQKSFCGAEAVVFMRKIFPHSNLIAKKVKPLSIKSTFLFYIREEKLSIFHEKLILQEGDLLVIFTKAQQSPKVKQWIYEL